MVSSINPFSVVCVRKDPDERAALETQVLFGEIFSVVDHVKGWVRVKLLFDGYEGWVSDKLLIGVSELEVEAWQRQRGVIISAPYVKLVREPDKSILHLSAGSRVAFNGKDLNSMVIGQREYYLQGSLNDRKPEIEDVAKGFLNVPYLWGGRSFFGIDCSGLVQVVFKIMGISLPRNASGQIEVGTIVGFVEDARPGDLAFFDNHNGEIVHVGICLGNGKILHASGEVRVDFLDHQGIFNHERKEYTHQLRLINRVM